MSIDFGKNQATADALDAYLSLEKPQFAALINSNWGSGKTWFAKTYLEHLKKRAREQELLCDGAQASEAPVFCYVSLFDIADSKEIDAAIMAQMNPALFSKGASLLEESHDLRLRKPLLFCLSALHRMMSPSVPDLSKNFAAAVPKTSWLFWMIWSVPVYRQNLYSVM